MHFRNIRVSKFPTLQEQLLLELSDGAPRAEVVFAATKHILKIDASKVAELMGQIADDHDEDGHCELLENPQFMECVHSQDTDTVNAHVERVKANQEMIRSTRQYLKKQTMTDGSKPTRKPCTFEAVETWSASMAEGLSPPQTKFYRDNWNKRWLCWCGDGPIGKRWCRSRSWGITGDDNRCIEELLKLAWQRHTDLTGEECPIVFQTVSAEASGAKKSSSSAAPPSAAAKASPKATASSQR